MATINDLGMPNPITVGFGGTGLASMPTPYGVICAGTTGTGPLQNVASVGTATQVLTSNGAGALPTWQMAGGGVVPNYTPPTSFSPTLEIAGNPSGFTYSQQLGTYMIIGGFLFVTMNVICSSVPVNSGTVSFHTASFPFLGNIVVRGTIWSATALFNVGNGSVGSNYTTQTDGGNTVFLPPWETAYINGQTNQGNMDGRDLTNTTQIMFSGFYYTA